MFRTLVVDGKPAISIVRGNIIDLNDFPVVCDYVATSTESVDQFNELVDFYFGNTDKIRKDEVLEIARLTGIPIKGE